MYRVSLVKDGVCWRDQSDKWLLWHKAVLVTYDLFIFFFRSETKFDSNSGMFTFTVFYWMYTIQVNLKRVVYQFKFSLVLNKLG